MSVENFQVERVGKTVKIWFDSGADIERSMVAFTHEFASEIEADLVRREVESRITERSESDYQLGIDHERRCIINDATGRIIISMNKLVPEVMRILEEGAE